MALALLKEQVGEDKLRTAFEVHLGSNLHYRLTVGSDETRMDNGIKIQEQPIFISQLKGPLSAEKLGRDTFSVPSNQFDRKNRFVQLISYKTKDLKGPAYSEIVPISNFNAFAKSFTSKTNTTMNHDIPQAKSKSFHYVKEIRHAEAMGIFDDIMKVAQKVLPVVGELIGKGKKKDGDKKEAGIGALLQNEELLQFFAKLFKGKTKKEESVNKEKAISQSLSNSAAPQLSKAAWAQMIPLIAEVAKSPEMWNGLNKFHETSINFLNDIMGGTLTDFSNFGDDTTNIVQQILQQDAMEKMAQLQLEAQAKAKAQSYSFSNEELSSSGLDFLRVESVELNLPNHSLGKGNQWASVVFNAHQSNTLTIEVNTPKTISKALLKICIRPLKGGKPIIEKKERVYQLENETLIPISFSSEELQKLHKGEENHLSIRLIWPNKKGLRIGTSASRTVMVSGKLSYEKVLGSTGEKMALDNVSTYRSFWHKVWAETLTKDRRQLSLDVKYYSALELDDEANKRLDSVSKIEVERGSKFAGKMKSGMEYSLESLNALLPLISNYPMLEEDELEALRNSNFSHYFTKVARKKIQFKGSPNESFALWAYPEIEIHKIELKGQENSAVAPANSNHVIHFPIPTKMHLVGTQVI